LTHLDDKKQRDHGLRLLAVVREAALQHRFTVSAIWIHDISLAREKTRIGDLDGAIALAEEAVDTLLSSGQRIWPAVATTVLVEALLHRGTASDLNRAQAAIDRLTAIPTDPGFVLYDLPSWRLRAILARAHGDETSYRDYRDRYRATAKSLGFEGHMKWAEAMP
jgi:adenylate cyclase